MLKVNGNEQQTVHSLSCTFVLALGAHDFPFPRSVFCRLQLWTTPTTPSWPNASCSNWKLTTSKRPSSYLECCPTMLRCVRLRFRREGTSCYNVLHVGIVLLALCAAYWLLVLCAAHRMVVLCAAHCLVMLCAANCLLVLLCDTHCLLLLCAAQRHLT